MMNILAPDAVAIIASGEVVERPASVVKELIENAVDAGATAIQIDIRGGGLEVIHVADNGNGIPAAAVRMAFLRHATSKIGSYTEVGSVQTLGFRGEALALIAAVSQVTCQTRATDEPAGVELRIAAGEVHHESPIERAVGTTMIVQHLFYNLPERHAFVRSEATELSYIISVVQRFALAYPQIGWTLRVNGRQRLQTAGDGDLHTVIAAIYDADLAGRLLPITATTEGEGLSYQVQGFISPPTLTRSSWADCHLIVNGRLIQPSGWLFAEIEEAYGTLVAADQFPVCILLLQLDPRSIDVTLHATKTQIKFAEPGTVRVLLGRAIRAALADYLAHVSRDVGTASTSTLQQRIEQGHMVQMLRQEPPSVAFLDHDHPVADGEGIGLSPSATAHGAVLPMADVVEGQPTGTLPPLRLLGDIEATYLVAEAPGAVYIIHRHAAHRRIIYDACWRQRGLVIPSEACATPLVLTPQPPVVALILDQQHALAEWGFAVDPWQPGQIVVRRKPIGLAPEHIASTLADISAVLEAVHASQNPETCLLLIRCVADHLAVPDGQPLDYMTQRRLVQQLERSNNPFVCPAGRTIIRVIARQGLDQVFG